MEYNHQHSLRIIITTVSPATQFLVALVSYSFQMMYYVVWDSIRCEGNCCNRSPRPPWFSVTLPAPTSDDIEVCICGNDGTDTEDTPIKLIQIFLQ